MKFELEWRERRNTLIERPSRFTQAMQTPRRFLDFVIDGESLYDRHGWDVISGLGWLDAAEDEHAAQRLLLQEPPDVDERVALYVCPEDADPYCGAVTATIERDGDEIVWRDLAYSDFDWLQGAWSHDSTGFEEWCELRFPATTYRRVIVSRATVG